MRTDGTANAARKKRAVRLTAPALSLLQDILVTKCAEIEGERLTSTMQSILMGVSVMTARKVLTRQGNDKAVLIHVFGNLGIPWKDQYCEPALTKNDPQITEGPRTSEPVRRSSLGSVAFVSLALLVALASTVSFRSDPRSSKWATARDTLESARQAYFSGQFEAALKLADTTYKTAQELQSIDIAANAQSLRGEIFAAAGDLTRAKESFDTALVLWRTVELPHGIGTTLEALGTAEARAGNFERAKQLFTECRAVLRSLNNGLESPGPLVGLGSIEAVCGNTSAADWWYGKASETLIHKPDEAMATNIRALRALLSKQRGNLDLARSELTACLRYWQAHGHSRWIANTERQLGLVELESGNLEVARRLLRRAEDAYTEVGDQKGRNDCRELARLSSQSVPSQTLLIDDYF